MVSVYSNPEDARNASNPYAGTSREMLGSIMYDDSGKYTVSERYAAAEELQKQDYTYISALGNEAVHSGTDQRQLYQGLLDYYDALSPVEKSVYPGGYREQIEGYLQQQETNSGTLIKQNADSIIQAMLTVFDENPPSGSTSTLTSKGPISSQLSKLTSSEG